MYTISRAFFPLPSWRAARSLALTLHLARRRAVAPSIPQRARTRNKPLVLGAELVCSRYDTGVCCLQLRY